MSAIFPTSVLIPVFTTTPLPRPYVTLLFEKAMFTRSPMPISPAGKIPISFSTGTDSPVKAASSIFNEAASNNRISAGTTSPASSITISPGTNSSLLIVNVCPSLKTVAFGVDICFNASIACSAFAS